MLYIAIFVSFIRQLSDYKEREERPLVASYSGLPDTYAFTVLNKNTL